MTVRLLPNQWITLAYAGESTVLAAAASDMTSQEAGSISGMTAAVPQAYLSDGDSSQILAGTGYAADSDTSTAAAARTPSTSLMSASVDAAVPLPPTAGFKADTDDNIDAGQFRSSRSLNAEDVVD